MLLIHFFFQMTHHLNGLTLIFFQELIAVQLELRSIAKALETVSACVLVFVFYHQLKLLLDTEAVTVGNVVTLLMPT